MNSYNNELVSYRKKQEFLFNLRKKYSNLLELDKNKRTEWRLTNFAKRRIVFQVLNLGDDEIKNINPLYRYRCYLYEPDDIELTNINLIYDEYMESIKHETDEGIKKIMIESLAETRKVQMSSLLRSKKTLKIPVMLDLLVYGKDPDIPIIFGDKIYQLDEITKEHIKQSFERVNPMSIRGERFIQMLNHSKVLRDSYWKEINKVHNDQKVNVRILQKARCDNK